MRKAKKLSRTERLEISILLERGYSRRAIALALGRGKTAIADEIVHNSTKGAYDPLKADAKARIRLRHRRLDWHKLDADHALQRTVVSMLQKHWNPDEIAGYLKRMKQPYVSKTAIYAWLRRGRGVRYCSLLYSKRQTKKKRMKKTRRTMIPDRVSIHRRFRGADNRTRYGHVEADTIVSGKRGNGAISVAVERKSRFVMLGKLETLRPAEHAAILRGMLARCMVKSITFDNGIENKDHRDLEIPTFFCDPYSSWQKGSVENANRMIRRYLPKGSDLSQVPQEELEAIADIINRKPRRVLGFRSAYDVAIQSGVLKDGSVLFQG
jgi:IS30 family transposase